MKEIKENFDNLIVAFRLDKSDSDTVYEIF